MGEEHIRERNLDLSLEEAHAEIARLQKKLRIFETASYADSVQGEATWKERAETAEACLAGKRETIKVLGDRLDSILRSAESQGIDLAGDPDYAVCKSFDNQRKLAYERQAQEEVEARVAELEEQIETQQGLKNLLAERDGLLGQLTALREFVERAYNADCERDDDGGVCEGEAAHILREVFSSNSGGFGVKVITAAEKVRDLRNTVGMVDAKELIGALDELGWAVERMREGE